MQALHTFIELGNPHYKGIVEDVGFKERCMETDPEGFKILFPDRPETSSNSSNCDISTTQPTVCPIIDNSSLQFNSQLTPQDETQDLKKPEQELDAEDEEMQYKTHDPVAKSQFNYNRSTCFGNNHPEIFVEENTEEPSKVAPGERKIPQSILYEEDLDVKTFPCFFPDGKTEKMKREMSLCQNKTIGCRESLI